MNIRLNNKLYSMDAVKKAILDFKEACNARIVSNAIEIELNPAPGEDSEVLEDEFCNYVLAVMRDR